MNEEKAVEINAVDTMRFTSVSDRTRDLLVILANLQDVKNSFFDWVDKYGLLQEESKNKILESTSKIEKVLFEGLEISIYESAPKSNNYQAALN